MNEAFREKDEKYRNWATSETLEKIVSKAVMVPFIISFDGAVNRDSDRRWKDFAPDTGRLGANGTKKFTFQWGHYGEVLQQGQLGLRDLENRPPGGIGNEP